MEAMGLLQPAPAVIGAVSLTAIVGSGGRAEPGNTEGFEDQNSGNHWYSDQVMSWKFMEEHEPMYYSYNVIIMDYNYEPIYGLWYNVIKT